MATPSSSSTTSPFGRGPVFRVATREISLDFAAIGPDQSPNDFGALSETAFRGLIEKYAAIDALQLLNGDPQLVVTAKRGRFVVLSAQGKLLVRSALDPQEPYTKFAPAELPAFLDAADQPTAAPVPAKNFQSLIGSAALVAESQAMQSSPSAAPIYGAFPVRPAAAPVATPSSPAPRKTAAPPPRQGRRSIVISAGVLAVLGGLAAVWFFFLRTPEAPPPPPAPVAEFDRIATPEVVASLQAHHAGTYATSGEAGERILELHADGTFHYQEFGASLATTANRKGTYLFAYRHATQTPLIRASGLGTIELRDEKTLVYQQAVFTKVP